MSWSKSAAGSLVVVWMSVTALQAAAVPVWDHSNVSFVTGGNVSDIVGADDFVITSATEITGATVWLSDSIAGDNGVLDSFSGVLSWAIYAESGGAPAALIHSGRAANIALADTGQQRNVNYDVVQVSFELSEAVQLDPGTYFLAIHEGEWTAAGDGSIVWWMEASVLAGAPAYYSFVAADPVTWFESGGGTYDRPFALYGRYPVWDQGASVGSTGLGISSFVAAADFTTDESKSFSTLDVWLLEFSASDNGVLDDFSGTLGWAIYTDNAGKPGTLLASGSDAAPQMADTGRQATANNSDLVRARIRLGGRYTFSAGTYWLALHEGAWGSAFDGSSISWAISSHTTAMNGSRLDGTPTAPSGWANLVGSDPAFILFDDQLFATGFEAGGTCAWTNGGSIDCP